MYDHVFKIVYQEILNYNLSIKSTKVKALLKKKKKNSTI